MRWKYNIFYFCCFIIDKYALPNPVVPVLPSLIKTEENLDSKMSKEVDMLGLNDVSVDPFAELANRDSLVPFLFFILFYIVRKIMILLKVYHIGKFRTHY